MTRRLLPLFLVTLAACSSPRPEPLRVMTFNLEDIRTDDLLRTDHPRLLRAVEVINRLHPDVVLLNEIAYDEPGVPGWSDGDEPGQNGRRFANLLGGTDSWNAFMAPSNTGHSSGFDLNHNGRVVTEWPMPPSAPDDGSQAPQTAEGRAYGDDSWGFGTFPGQYAMAILVRDRHEILVDSVRTFRTFRWSRLPDALHPVNPETGMDWYESDIWSRFPLSSKSHWDVPVRTESGQTVHILASHPTPPAFDGPERRNTLRNHDEIHFWAAYLDGDDAIVDDSGRPGGLAPDASFVLLGDLNSDPDEGSSLGYPVGRWLLSHPRVNGSYVPVADSTGISAFPRIDPDDTARWGLRVDYVLPSSDFEILAGGVARPADSESPAASDHFPVWIDLAFPQ